jgi:Anthrone oxygenase
MEVEKMGMNKMGDASGSRSVVVSTLLILSCLLLGLLAGGMLLIGVSFLSFWRSLSPADFQAWFASYSHLIGRLMIPLGGVGLLVTVAALAVCWRGSQVSRRWLIIAVVSALVVIVTYPLFFQTTNESFVRGGLSDSVARALLDRWATWHWIRTAVGIFGFLAALRALHG